jgi:hypothetical protein
MDCSEYLIIHITAKMGSLKEAPDEFLQAGPFDQVREKM